MSKQIDVRIRHGNDLKAVPLTTWPMDELNELMSTVGEWGLTTPEGVTYDDASFGQIVVGESGAFFEIVFGVGDE